MTKAPTLPATADPDELWGPADVAKFCNVSRSTVYYWRHIRTGPPSAKIGRHVRYRPADVRAWIDQQWKKDPAGAA